MSISLSTLPLAAQAEFDRIGPIWGSDIQKHRDIVLAAFDPILGKAPKEGVTITRDHAYGRHPRQVLDLYQPTLAAGGKPAPVVIFMHGGSRRQMLLGLMSAKTGVMFAKSEPET